MEFHACRNLSTTLTSSSILSSPESFERRASVTQPRMCSWTSLRATLSIPDFAAEICVKTTMGTHRFVLRFLGRVCTAGGRGRRPPFLRLDLDTGMCEADDTLAAL